MKHNNDTVITLLGVGLLGYYLFTHNSHPVAGYEISGISPSKRNLIKKYLWAIGLPEGAKQLEAKWARMSEQQIINDAYKNDVIFIENAQVRKDLITRLAKATGSDNTAQFHRIHQRDPLEDLLRRVLALEAENRDNEEIERRSTTAFENYNLD